MVSTLAHLFLGPVQLGISPSRCSSQQAHHFNAILLQRSHFLPDRVPDRRIEPVIVQSYLTGLLV